MTLVRAVEEAEIRSRLVGNDESRLPQSAEIRSFPSSTADRSRGHRVRSARGRDRTRDESPWLASRTHAVGRPGSDSARTVSSAEEAVADHPPVGNRLGQCSGMTPERLRGPGHGPLRQLGSAEDGTVDAGWRWGKSRGLHQQQIARSGRLADRDHSDCSFAGDLAGIHPDRVRRG
jgi:hypothetical protein